MTFLDSLHPVELHTLTRGLQGIDRDIRLRDIEWWLARQHGTEGGATEVWPMCEACEEPIIGTNALGLAHDYHDEGCGFVAGVSFSCGCVGLVHEDCCEECA